MATPPVPFPIGLLAGDRVPWVDEPECVGCNLCQLVCPVDGCITMEEATLLPKETWNDRVGQGLGKVPGGIHDA
jgi:dihydropyrimidine dehydrogenase (NAD+) subunit PreA